MQNSFNFHLVLILTICIHTWRKLAFEHVEGDDVDDHNPAWAVQKLWFAAYEAHCADALALQLPSVRIRLCQLSVHVVLELLKVEQLFGKRKKN